MMTKKVQQQWRPRTLPIGLGTDRSSDCFLSLSLSRAGTPVWGSRPSSECSADSVAMLYHTVIPAGRIIDAFLLLCYCSLAGTRTAIRGKTLFALRCVLALAPCNHPPARPGPLFVTPSKHSDPSRKDKTYLDASQNGISTVLLRDRAIRIALSPLCPSLARLFKFICAHVSQSYFRSLRLLYPGTWSRVYTSPPD